MNVKVTIKNLGPEPAHGIGLRLLLPDAAKIVAPQQYENEEPGLTPLFHALDDLATGAIAEFELSFEDRAQREDDAKDNDTTVLALITTAAYDPDAANNGHLERTHWKAKYATVRVFARREEYARRTATSC